MGIFEAVSSRLFFGSEPPASKSPKSKLKQRPRRPVLCVLRRSLPPVGGTSLFPAKREVKREARKAWQAWPGNQTPPRSLVRSLVCLAGCIPLPHVSKEVPEGASDRCGRCSQRVCEGLVAAWAAQPSAASPEESEWKKVAHEFHCAVSIAKSSKTLVFELAVCLKKICRRR